MITVKTLTILRWTARILTIPIFLFWGAFFLEHMSWFSNPSHLPPWHVFLTVGFHGLILVGLALSWKWEIPGSVITIVAAALFFAKAAGPNFIIFTALTSIPSILFIVLKYIDPNKHIGGETAVPEGKTA